jgi:hypothetical protein
VVTVDRRLEQEGSGQLGFHGRHAGGA